MRYTPGDLIRRFAQALRPNRYQNLLPSTRGLLGSTVSALGAYEPDFWASLEQGFPQGINPATIAAGDY